MSFPLVPKSVTLNDLERRNGRYFALFQRIPIASGAHCVKVHVRYLISWLVLVFFVMHRAHIVAVDCCQSGRQANTFLMFLCFSFTTLPTSLLTVMMTFCTQMFLLHCFSLVTINCIIFLFIRLMKAFFSVHASWISLTACLIQLLMLALLMHLKHG